MNNNATTNNFKINFYNNLEQAIHHNSRYLIFCSEIPYDINNQTVDAENIDENKVKEILEEARIIKLFIHKLQIEYNVLVGETENDKKQKKQIKEHYDKITTTQFPKSQDLEAYLTLMSKFLIETIGDIDFGNVANNL
jgi:hypothetical protein